MIYTEQQLAKLVVHEDYIVQEFLGDRDFALEAYTNVEKLGLPLVYSLEQTKFAIQMYLGESKFVSEPLCTKHVMKQGISIRVEPVSDQCLDEIGKRYAKALQLIGCRGPVNIQCHALDEPAPGNFSVYELSGRYTGATFARYLLGHDELALAFKEKLGMVLPPCPRMGSQNVVIKQPTEILSPQASIESLQNSGQWNG